MRAVIVDDQELMRRGLQLLLSTSEIEVVGEARDGREAMAVIRRQSPDVVLADAHMPVLDGVAMTRELRAAGSSTPVIILTTFDDEDLVRHAMGAGAAGFLLKDTPTEDLVHAMTAVADGGLVIDPRVARALLTQEAPRESPLGVLTRAERAVAAEVATGASNAEIAGRLVIAEGTVKNHVSSVLRKLGHRDRTSLALYLSRVLG